MTKTQEVEIAQKRAAMVAAAEKARVSYANRRRGWWADREACISATKVYRDAVRDGR